MMLLEDIDEARVAMDSLGNYLNDAIQHGMEGIGCGYPAPDVMQEVNIADLFPLF
jgi:hypothetical protein